MAIGWREAAERLKERNSMPALKEEELRALFIKNRKSLSKVSEEMCAKGAISEETNKKINQICRKE